jgi:low temperature requirement protein LtrA
LAVRPTDDSHRVTTLELFFDLVFVFALTQVTALMAGDPTVRGLGRGLVLLALLWFGWSSYAWLGNQARADEGLLRVAMLAAMGALFVVALAIPESYEDKPGGLFAPFVLAACYATVRIAHLVVYLVAAGDDRALRRQLLIQAVPTTIALLLLVAGGAAGPPWQSVLWVLALVVDYVGVFAGGTQGWRVYSAPHFAERHGLIIIVALGESVVAVGAGIAHEPVTAAVVLAALLGLGVSVALWWVYFDVVALVAERVLARLEGEPRSRLARDSFTYLHFPMLAGIVYLALGMKKVLTYSPTRSTTTSATRFPGCRWWQCSAVPCSTSLRCPRCGGATSAAGTCSAWWRPQCCCSCCRSAPSSRPSRRWRCCSPCWPD